MKKQCGKHSIPKHFSLSWGRAKQLLDFPKGRIIFTQGDAANNVFYIQSGKVKMTVVSEQGKEAVVGILEAGQFFGEGWPEWSFRSHRHSEDARTQRHHFNSEKDDPRCA